MEMAMLMAGGMLRETDFAWASEAGYDGVLRLAIAVLAVAALVLTLEQRGLGWIATAALG